MADRFLTALAVLVVLALLVGCATRPSAELTKRLSDAIEERGDHGAW